MKIGVTSPIFLSNSTSKKLLDLTTKSLRSKDHDLFWLPCKNYVHQDYEPLNYSFTESVSHIENLDVSGQQSVARAWNVGIDKASKSRLDYVLVINDDIVLKRDAIDCLASFAANHKEAVLWSAAECKDIDNLENWIGKETFSEHPHFSCFMVKSDFFSHVGKFDENFVPAYFEDNDMHARLALAGKKALKYESALFYHFGSQTIRNDRKARERSQVAYSKLKHYFSEKWGHPAVDDVETMREVYYKCPYNEQDKPLSYWRTPQTQNIGLSEKINDLVVGTYYNLKTVLVH